LKKLNKDICKAYNYLYQMDKDTFIYFVTTRQPIYAKYTIYKKIDGAWYQSDITILNRNDFVLFKGHISPAETFGNDGDVYLHLKDPIVYISKNNAMNLINITFENFNTDIRTYNISLGSINTHTYIANGDKIFETIISTGDIHLVIVNSDTIKILDNSHNFVTIFRVPPDAIKILNPN
jgi:hypothetical protein